ncbi:CPBP family intramembrane metalloprotease [Rhodococcus sp. G-MC3]|uniref:CPBP family intramembrane glutamic endopeptidase n=1 Tax=Rhodococcus sp. G-MC3 TaxID=3046209 RepID=UPI0024B8E485|nr:CPBP family intramembrane glutamic endopeptidase [Rhodococcus sp. G-MC3]MDJ0394344.1 CPBP family intramembrane metalloprotease [Rhodococcus sp. G-MC3]
MIDVKSWLNPPPPEAGPPLEPSERRAIKIEIALVLLVTFGLSGLSSILSLIEDALLAGSLSDQTVALNTSSSSLGIIDLLYQLLRILRLCAWGGLGLYLLWRAGLGPRRIGLARPRAKTDLLQGLGLAALIGLPGLVFYLIGNAIGLNLTVLPSTINDHWWRLPALVAYAFANSGAEEIIVVAYLISRLRRLGLGENSSLFASAVLRGSYHLYQGLGAGIGNLLMGLVFGRFWQKTNRLWPLLIAHALIDIVAFVGYTALRTHLSWLP